LSKNYGLARHQDQKGWHLSLSPRFFLRV
jgi:hypothetical protein